MELLRRYSNQAAPVKPLVRLLAEVHNPIADHNDAVTNTVGQTARPDWQAADRLTYAEVAGLVKRYQDGATLGALADGYKISRGTVRRLLRHEGVELRRRGLNPEQIDEAVQLYGQGWSLARIGEKLDVTANTVQARLRERGVSMRDTHGRARHA